MKPYTPQLLPAKGINLLSKVDLLVEASNNLVRYDEKLKVLPNPSIFLSPLQQKEAVKSSLIEGTQTTLDQVLKSEADPNLKVEDTDIKEVLNYRDAMKYSINSLNKKPLGLNLIKDIQKILLQDVRGNDKPRGEFRKEQVWIGPKGCSQEEADYVPPEWTEVSTLLDNWERYVHTEDINPLIQAAVIHAQFEIIHPFVDGNGRVGRILLPLYLYQRSIISEPMFYLSGYLEKNRDEYISSLSRISLYKDWNVWIEFFLNAVNEQAKHNLEAVNDITNLYQETKEQLVKTRSPYQTMTLDALFMFPFFTSTRFGHAAKIKDRGTAIRLITRMEELGIVHKISKQAGSRPAMYVFPKLLNILRQ